MFAENLESVLSELCRRGDFSSDHLGGFATRFDSLRAYGKLPRGRNNREQRLSPTQIAAAIYGLVPTNPKWAGHATAILADLRPVGGVEASFFGASNLTEAVARLLTDAVARGSLVTLTL